MARASFNLPKSSEGEARAIVKLKRRVRKATGVKLKRCMIDRFGYVASCSVASGDVRKLHTSAHKISLLRASKGR